MAPMNCCMPLQYVDFPAPGGPTTSCANGIVALLCANPDAGEWTKMFKDEIKMQANDAGTNAVSKWGQNDFGCLLSSANEDQPQKENSSLPASLRSVRHLLRDTLCQQSVCHLVSGLAAVYRSRLTPSGQYPIPQPPADAVSALRFSPHPDSTKFAVASWDANVYLYEIGPDKQCTQVGKYEHRAPVLDVCFGIDDHTLYSACLDWDVRRQV